MEYENRSETPARMWQAVLLSWWLFGTLASCCPQYCRCFTDDDGYKVANCSKSGLISSDPAPTIDVLNFKNQVRGTQTKLEARIFKNFRGVKYLNLRNTSISQLPTDVFYGLSRVNRLDLSYNKIKHLNGVVFKGLPNLRYLSLRGNFLSISPLEVIVSETLQDLDMGSCSITNIPLYTFSSAPNIRQLILDGNFIQTLEYNVLPKGLTYLNLANNNIVKPPINVFNSLRHLIRLDISNNPINCSCSLLVFQDTLSGRAGMLENGVRCNYPSHLFGKEISTVNENQLCRDDYMNREGLNGFVHFRTKKSHHHNNNQYNVLSDDQFMGDESYGQREAAEVMFTNDETNQMGTHMEARIQGSVSPNAYGETSDNNKVTPIGEDSPAETQDPHDQNGYRTSEEAQENHLTTKDDDREQLEEGHQTMGTGANDNASVEDHSTKLEDFSETSQKGETDDNLVSHQTNIFEGNHGSSNDESSSINNNINTISFDASSSSNDPTNSLHGSEPATQYTTLTSGFSSQSEVAQDEPLLSPASMLMADVDNENNSTTSKMTDDDVDVSDLLSHDHESHSNLELEDDPFPTTESSTSHDLVDIPSSPTEPSDYNYDAHHDYGTGDHTTSSEISDDSPKPTEITHDASSSTPETEIDNEGSGDYAEPELTSSESTAYSSSTVKFLEEQEPETESSSLRTVSDEFGDVSSTDSSSPYVTTDVILSSSSDSSSTDMPSSSTTEESSLLDQLTTEPTLVSSETPSTEASSTSSEPSSSEPSSSEPITPETSSEASSSTPSEDPTIIEQTTTEEVTVPSISSSSEETSSRQYDTTPEVSSSTAAVSWELSSTTEPSSSTESSSRRGFWWDSDEELSSPSSSPSTIETVLSSSIAPVYKKPKMIEFTTEKPTTDVSEVEVLTTFVGGAHNENIVVDKNRDDEEKSALISGVTYTIIGLLMALVLILLTVVACRRKSPTKVRLPVDPETAAGTEMQDMLLPKSSSGNGVKVGRPNTYTNGSAAPITNGKPKLDNVQDPEETVPVLLADPEQEPEPPEPEITWDDKPEPIEAVTARLTMLARPQTPIFIQKPIA